MVSNALGILIGIILAKSLGPIGKGAFSSVQLVQSGVVSVTAGAGSAITYFLTNKKRSVGSFIGALASLLLSVSLVSWLLLGLWALKYGLTTVIYVVALAIPASVVLSWQNYYFVGIGEIKRLNIQSVFVTVSLFLAVLVLVVMLHLGIPGVFAAWLISLYLSAIVVIVHAIKTANGFKGFTFGPDFKQLIHFGSRTALNGIVGFLNLRIDSIILIALLGVSQFGIYSVATAAAEMMFLVSGAFGMAIARDIGTLTFELSAEMTAKAARSITLVMVMIAIPLIVLTPWLIHTVYGDRFITGTPALRILVIGVILQASGGPLGSFFTYQMGRPIVLLYFLVALIGVQSALCLALIPRLGLTGAAIASTSTYIIGAIMRTAYFHRVTGLSATKLWIAHAGDLSTFKSAFEGLIRR